MNALAEVGVVPAGAEVEVSAKPKRRRFTAKEKLAILDEVDACTQTGAVGAVLRRNGIYSSYLTTWRQARSRGELEALGPKKRGPKARVPHPLERRVVELEHVLAKTEARAKHAEALVELQKKVAELLGTYLPPADGTR